LQWRRPILSRMRWTLWLSQAARCVLAGRGEDWSGECSCEADDAQTLEVLESREAQFVAAVDSLATPHVRPTLLALLKEAKTSNEHDEAESVLARARVQFMRAFDQNQGSIHREALGMLALDAHRRMLESTATHDVDADLATEPVPLPGVWLRYQTALSGLGDVTETETLASARAALASIRLLQLLGTERLSMELERLGEAVARAEAALSPQNESETSVAELFAAACADIVSRCTSVLRKLSEQTSLVHRQPRVDPVIESAGSDVEHGDEYEDLARFARTAHALFRRLRDLAQAKRVAQRESDQAERLLLDAGELAAEERERLALVSLETVAVEELTGAVKLALVCSGLSNAQAVSGVPGVASAE
jgi:hypothetical protein